MSWMRSCLTRGFRAQCSLSSRCRWCWRRAARDPRTPVVIQTCQLLKLGKEMAEPFSECTHRVCGIHASVDDINASSCSGAAVVVVGGRAGGIAREASQAPGGVGLADHCRDGHDLLLFDKGDLCSDFRQCSTPPTTVLVQIRIRRANSHLGAREASRYPRSPASQKRRQCWGTRSRRRT